MPKPDQVTLDHGSGGQASEELLRTIFLSRLDNNTLRRLDDSAVLDRPPGRLAMTTDSYVVDPIVFPGGNIGSLAVHGTVNDLSMQGAEPLYLSLAIILEEGFPLSQLETLMDSAAEACKNAGVKVVTGDTKVVPKGHLDKVFINTSGIGTIPEGVHVNASNAAPGDTVIINGDIGLHGLTILTRREGLSLEADLETDSAPLNGLVSTLIGEGHSIHVLRDPTRGGVATALNDIAQASGVSIRLYEESLPIPAPVSAASELLGLDPLYVANEGKCLVIAPEAQAERIVKTMKRHQYGRKAAVIGEIEAHHPGTVLLQTSVGGTRIISTLAGEQLPRIC